MIGHYDVRAQIDKKFVHLDPERDKAVHLFEHDFGIDNDAVADYVHRIGVENTARNKMKFVRFIPVDDGVTRIAPSGSADDIVRFFGKYIYYLAFALVAPLRADQCRCIHNQYLR